MKKILVLGLCMMFAMGAMGCSKDGNQGNKGNKGKQGEITAEEGMDEISVTFLGKIKKVVGNEIELDIAKDPFLAGPESNESVEAGDGNGEGEKGEEVEAIQSTVVSEPTQVAEGELSPEDEAGRLEMLEKENQKMELEYVGETKSFTIPAGAKLFDTKLGKEVSLTSIKNGSVIRIYGSGTEESPSILYVDIME